MNDSLLSVLEQYISSQILKQPNRKINPDESLISGGLIDSFSLVDLALFVEDTFGVRIDDSELNAQTFDSLNQLVTLIQSRQVK
ncbi:MAG: acyl carrier protein [Chloroflexi bacterium]|nr:acyl carrier protein [Chloroflexota bacterium]MCL5611088.1 acyl carrier protein [Chloroflexota bacterium]